MIEPRLTAGWIDFTWCQLRHETTPSATKEWIETDNMDWYTISAIWRSCTSIFSCQQMLVSPTPCCSYLPLFRLRANCKENLLPRALSKTKKTSFTIMFNYTDGNTDNGLSKKFFLRNRSICPEVIRLEKNQLVDLGLPRKYVGSQDRLAYKIKTYTKHCFPCRKQWSVKHVCTWRMFVLAESCFLRQEN